MQAGDLVGHPVHGRGTVLYKFGDFRMVKLGSSQKTENKAR